MEDTRCKSKGKILHINNCNKGSYYVKVGIDNYVRDRYIFRTSANIWCGAFCKSSKPLTIFAKCSLLDVWQGSENASSRDLVCIRSFVQNIKTQSFILVINQSADIYFKIWRVDNDNFWTEKWYWASNRAKW